MRGSLVKHALVFRDDIIHDYYDWDGYARLMYLKLRQAIAGCFLELEIMQPFFLLYYMKSGNLFLYGSFEGVHTCAH